MGAYHHDGSQELVGVRFLDYGTDKGKDTFGLDVTDRITADLGNAYKRRGHAYIISSHAALFINGIQCHGPVLLYMEEGLPFSGRKDRQSDFADIPF